MIEMAKPTAKSPAADGDEARPELPPPAPPQPRASRDDLDARERSQDPVATDDGARSPTTNPPVLATPPSPQEPPAPLRYLVWSHGALQRNGVTHEPGSILELTPEQATAIGECVQPVAPSKA